MPINDAFTTNPSAQITAAHDDVHEAGRSRERGASIGRECEHAWDSVSRHATSEGAVIYARCVRCAQLRIEVQRGGELMPTPIGHLPISAKDD